MQLNTKMYFRSLIFHITPLVQGSIKLMMTVSEKPQHHDLLVTAPGYLESEHTSLLLDLTQHNTYSQHHLFIQNVTNNLVKLSLTGDTLGPLLLNEVKTSVRALKIKYLNKYPPFYFQLNCFDSVAQLSILLSHYKYRKFQQLKIESSLTKLMNSAYQQILSCKQPQGGMAVHFNGGWVADLDFYPGWKVLFLKRKSFVETRNSITMKWSFSEANLGILPLTLI